MRSEHFMTLYEIRRFLDGSNEKGGPVLAVCDGKRYKSVGEAHSIFLGMTGSGKTLMGINSMILSFITSDARESFICVDPKGDIYRSTSSMARERDYEVRLVSYRDVTHSEGFNPLWVPYQLFKSVSPGDRQRAYDLIADIANAIYPDERNADPFWNQSARALFTAACLTLFHEGKEEEINIPSLYSIVTSGGEKNGLSNYLKDYVRSLPDNRAEKLLFQSYTNAPNETALSIRSVYLNGLSPYITNEGMKAMAGNDTLNMLQMDDSKPLALYIVLPDESAAYSTQASMLCNQLILHFIHIAHSRGNGALTRRLNIVLEELASIGKSLPDLPHLMAAGRSRNIRVHCVLQDMGQLNTLYGDANASTIRNNADIIMFRLRDWETLKEFSLLCGNRVIQLCDGTEVSEPLVTEAQLAQLATGQALVFFGTHKLVSRLPYYGDIFDLSGWTEPAPYPTLPIRPCAVLKFPLHRENDPSMPPKGTIALGGREADLFGMAQVPFGADEVLTRPESIRKPNDNTHRYRVQVIGTSGNHHRIVGAILEATNMSIGEAIGIIQALPCEICLNSKSEAEKLKMNIERAGGTAIVLPPAGQ